MKSTADNDPCYHELAMSGELEAQRGASLAMLAECRLCPRGCGPNRLEDERGVCRVGRHAIVSSTHAHFGEEEVLVGKRGSGTIFFSGYNLKCVFCQNYEISHELAGNEVSPPRRPHAPSPGDGVP